MKRIFIFIITFFFWSALFCGQAINWEWTKYATGIEGGYDQGTAIATDTNGNIIITGYFHANLKFDSITITNPSADNIFVAKYSSSGNLLWVKNPSVTGVQSTIKAFAMATDISGNIYVTGSYSGNPINFDSITLPNTTYNAIFVVKYNPSGKVLWAKSWGGGFNTGFNNGGNCVAYGISVGIYGIYLTGRCDVAVDFGGTAVADPGIFVARFDNNCNPIWIKGPTNGGGNGICTDAQGNAYATGGTTTAKYDNQGNVIWASSAIPANGNGISANSIAIDTFGNSYVTGLFGGNIAQFGSFTVQGAINETNFFLVKYDNTGRVEWTKDPGTVGTNNAQFSAGWCLAFDEREDRLYLGGGFEDTAIHIDSLTLKGSQFESDGFVIVMEPSGAIDCSSVIEAAGTTSGICVDNESNGYMCSDYGSDISTAKFMCPDCAFIGINFGLSSNNLCPGDSVEIDLSGNPNVSISPNNYVTWIDSIHATLKPSNTTTFTLQGYTSCGIYKTQSFTLTVLSDSIGITSDKLTICSSDSAQICAPDGFTSYKWNNGDTAACFYTSDAGNYMVTVSENGNCSASSNPASISVYQVSPVSTTANGDTLAGFNSGNCQWMLNGVAIPGATSSVYIANIPGSYTLQVTDSNGCIAASSPVFVTDVTNILPENIISIFPNPSNTIWQLSVDRELIGGTAEVFDATGRLVCKLRIVNAKSQIVIPIII